MSYKWEASQVSKRGQTLSNSIGIYLKQQEAIAESYQKQSSFIAEIQILAINCKLKANTAQEQDDAVYKLITTVARGPNAKN